MRKITIIKRENGFNFWYCGYVAIPEEEQSKIIVDDEAFEEQGTYKGHDCMFFGDEDPIHGWHLIWDTFQWGSPQDTPNTEEYLLNVIKEDLKDIF